MGASESSFQAEKPLSRLQSKPNSSANDSIAYQSLEKLYHPFLGQVLLVNGPNQRVFTVTETPVPSQKELKSLITLTDFVKGLKHANLLEIDRFPVDVQQVCAVKHLFEHHPLDLHTDCKLRRANGGFYQPGEVLAVLGQMVAALAFLQRKGVVHGTVNTRTVFVDQKVKEPCYKLLPPCGIGRTDNWQKVDELGSLAEGVYLSPTQVKEMRERVPIKRGLSVNSYKSDVWSLGCIILGMLSPEESDSLFDYIRFELDEEELTRRIGRLREQGVDPFLINTLSWMLEAEEKPRCDFVDLERHLVAENEAVLKLQSEKVAENEGILKPKNEKIAGKEGILKPKNEKIHQISENDGILKPKNEKIALKMDVLSPKKSEKEGILKPKAEKVSFNKENEAGRTRVSIKQVCFKTAIEEKPLEEDLREIYAENEGILVEKEGETREKEGNNVNLREKIVINESNEADSTLLEERLVIPNQNQVASTTIPIIPNQNQVSTTNIPIIPNQNQVTSTILPIIPNQNQVASTNLPIIPNQNQVSSTSFHPQVLQIIQDLQRQKHVKPSSPKKRDPFEKSPPKPTPNLSFFTESFSDGSIYEGEKRGNLRFGTGTGTFNYSDGCRYEGGWVDDRRHGFGTLYYPNKRLEYVGMWEQDRFNGKGSLYNRSPGFLRGFDGRDFNRVGNGWNKYEGEFKNGVKEGKGQLFLMNGDVFEGEFKGDAINGQGVYRMKNGEELKGHWRSGVYENE